MRLQFRMAFAMSAVWIVTVFVTVVTVYWYASRPVERLIGEQMVIQAIITSHLVDVAEDRKNDTPVDAALRKQKLQARLEAISRRVKEDHGLDLEFWITDEKGNAYLNTGNPDRTFYPDFRFLDDPVQQPQASAFIPLLKGEKTFVIQNAQRREVDPRLFKFVAAGGTDKPRIVQIGFPFDDVKRTANNIFFEGVMISGGVLLAGLIPFLVVARFTISPVQVLTDAAEAFMADEFDPKMLDRVRIRKDGLGRLASVFCEMASEVDLRYSTLLNEIHSAVLKIHENGTITFANDFAQRLFGYHDLVGRPMDDIIVPEHRREVSERLEKLKLGGSQINQSNDNRTKDGQRLHMIWANVPIRKKDGKIEYFCIGNDITKEEAARSGYLADTSHDLRTPLNAIILMAERLAKTPLPDEARTEIAGIRKQGALLRQMMDDILDLARLKVGQMPIHNTAFSLRDCLNDAVHAPTMDAESKGVAFKMMIPDHTTDHLFGDRTKLQKVVMNLAQNAVNATDAGTITVEVRSEPLTGDMVGLQIIVTDTGIGFSPEKKRLFDSAEFILPKRGGTGRGLTIVRALVKLMGGEITLTSEESRGTTFVVKLAFPTAGEPSVAGIPPPLADAGAANDTSPGRALRILLVDDHHLNRTLTARIMTDQGWFVEQADSGPAAIAQWKKMRFDVILMDVEMDGVNGLDATREIRAAERGEHTLILALTAHATDGYAERCLEAGMDGFLTKPFLPDELLRSVQNLATRYRRLPEASGRGPGTKTSEASNPAARGGIDLPALMNHYQADRRLLLATIDAFLADSPKALSRVRDAVAGAGKLRKVAHDLKGLCLCFYHPGAAAAAQRLIELGQPFAPAFDGHSPAPAAAALSAVEREIASLRDQLSQLKRENSL